MIAQLAICQIDTTNKYPVLQYPGYTLEDTCVLFTQKQAKLAAIDGINADACQQVKDSLKSAVRGQQELINLKNEEIRKKDLDIKARNEIIYSFKYENKQLKGWWNDAESKLKLTKKVDAIVYPILGTLVLTGIIYIAVSH